MLYGYTYQTHSLDQLHEFLKHIVFDVWKSASGNFTITKIDAQYRDLVQNTNPKYLKNPIKEVFRIYKRLSSTDITTIETAFTNNNNIQGLCDGSVTPVHYAQIKLLGGNAAIGKKLANQLFILCTTLYTEIPKLKPCYDSYGKLIERYHTFVSHPDVNYCPFCGLHQILNEYHTVRSDYDHFFPKELYPFTAINFHNLIPMCDDCNTRYKKRQDPINLREGVLANRKVVLNPYNLTNYTVDFRITINRNTLTNLEPDHLTIDISNSVYTNEKNRWEEIFQLPSRYKNLCVGKENKTWLQQYLDFKNLGLSHDQIINVFSKNKYSERNFIKVSFLEECHRKGFI